MKIIYSEKFLEHKTPSTHPESPARLKVIINQIKSDKLPVVFEEPEKINDDELAIVHGSEYLERLKFFCSRGESTSDNPFNKDTFEIAKLAAGAAKKAAENSLEEFSFALVRPPGHHAGKEFFGGFCYLNNIAFAIKSMQKKGIGKAMIVDFDVHFGNGTYDIFRNDPAVFYLSFHQDPNTIFPYSGFESENNEHMKNIILKPGCDDETYLKIFKSNVSKYVKEFKPELIGISAGFDTYYLDYYAGNQLKISETTTYNKIGETIRKEAEKLKCGMFGVLEGGYYLERLGENFCSFAKAFI
jgi:acetoin utilization deacetylase AcuC-like enzyme